MKGILIVFLVSTGFSLYGQLSFNYHNDFKKILSETKDSTSNYFYNRLLERFKVNDSTMSDSEILALLIGFTEKPEYKPYKDIFTESEIYKLNGEKKYREAISQGGTFLISHPLNVKTIFEMYYGYRKSGLTDSADFYLYQGLRILNIMNKTGDGRTPETAIFALGPADGQEFIYKFLDADIGTMGSGSDKHGNFVDMLEAKFDDGTRKMYYFVIEHATAKMFDD